MISLPGAKYTRLSESEQTLTLRKCREHSRILLIWGTVKTGLLQTFINSMVTAVYLTMKQEPECQVKRMPCCSLFSKNRISPQVLIEPQRLKHVTRGSPMPTMHLLVIILCTSRLIVTLIIRTLADQMSLVPLTHTSQGVSLVKRRKPAPISTMTQARAANPSRAIRVPTLANLNLSIIAADPLGFEWTKMKN